MSKREIKKWENGACKPVNMVYADGEWVGTVKEEERGGFLGCGGEKVLVEYDRYGNEVSHTKTEERSHGFGTETVEVTYSPDNEEISITREEERGGVGPFKGETVEVEYDSRTGKEISQTKYEQTGGFLGLGTKWTKITRSSDAPSASPGHSEEEDEDEVEPQAESQRPTSSDPSSDEWEEIPPRDQNFPDIDDLDRSPVYDQLALAALFQNEINIHGSPVVRKLEDGTVFKALNDRQGGFILVRFKTEEDYLHHEWLLSLLDLDKDSEAKGAPQGLTESQLGASAEDESRTETDDSVANERCTPLTTGVADASAKAIGDAYVDVARRQSSLEVTFEKACEKARLAARLRAFSAEEENIYVIAYAEKYVGVYRDAYYDAVEDQCNPDADGSYGARPQNGSE